MGFIGFMAGAAINVLYIIGGFAIFFAIAGKKGRAVIKGFIQTVFIALEVATIKLKNKLIQKLEKAPAEEIEEDDPTKVDAHVI